MTLRSGATCTCGELMLDGGAAGLYCPKGFKCPDFLSFNPLVEAAEPKKGLNRQLLRRAAECLSRL